MRAVEAGNRECGSRKEPHQVSNDQDWQGVRGLERDEAARGAIRREFEVADQRLRRCREIETRRRQEGFRLAVFPRRALASLASRGKLLLLGHEWSGAVTTVAERRSTTAARRLPAPQRAIAAGKHDGEQQEKAPTACRSFFPDMRWAASCVWSAKSCKATLHICPNWAMNSPALHEACRLRHLEFRRDISYIPGSPWSLDASVCSDPVRP